MKKAISISAGVTVLAILIPILASAHQPVTITEPAGDTVLNNLMNVGAARAIPDPSITSEAVYDALLQPGEVRLYSFTAEETAIIPVEVLVPARLSNKNFRPAFAVISRVDGQGAKTTLPFNLSVNYAAVVVNPPEGNRETFFEPYSVEQLYRGTQILYKIEAGKRYYIAVYEPNKQVGDFALAIGDKENFSGVSYFSLVKSILLAKFGLVGGRQAPWLDITGLFLLIISLFAGLGLATIAGITGLLSRQSRYWLGTARRLYNFIDIPVWISLALTIAGGLIFFREVGFGGIPAILAMIIFILVINEWFLNPKISQALMKLKSGKDEKTNGALSAKVRKDIIVNFAISFLGYIGALLLLIWYLLV